MGNFVFMQPIVETESLQDTDPGNYTGWPEVDPKTGALLLKNKKKPKKDGSNVDDDQFHDEKAVVADTKKQPHATGRTEGFHLQLDNNLDLVEKDEESKQDNKPVSKKPVFGPKATIKVFGSNNKHIGTFNTTNIGMTRASAAASKQGKYGRMVFVDENENVFEYSIEELEQLRTTHFNNEPIEESNNMNGNGHKQVKFMHNIFLAENGMKAFVKTTDDGPKQKSTFLECMQIQEDAKELLENKEKEAKAETIEESSIAVQAIEKKAKISFTENINSPRNFKPTKNKKILWVE